MNAPNSAVVPFKANIPALQMDEAQLVEVLRSSLFPGAKVESILMVIGYCRASGLDPMQKPVHIVPMNVKSGKKDSDGKDIYEDRDVIMPGIGLYRTQAARSGDYAGISEPIFGETKTLDFSEEYWDNRQKHTRPAKLEFPEWCKVTVKRIVNGTAVEFTAIEYWLENYATQSRYTNAPNAMWKRRPRGQIVKCAEAQALRKAFPEIGAQPTADELEGKTLEDTGVTIDGTATHVQTPARKSDATPAASTAKPAEGEKPKADEKSSGEEKVAADDAKLTPSMQKVIRGRMKSANITNLQLARQFNYPDASDPVELLPASKANDVLAWIRDMSEAAGS